jgi:acyl dehydratase
MLTSSYFHTRRAAPLPPRSPRGVQVGSAAVPVAEVQGIEGLKSIVGVTVGPGEWRQVTQEDIDTFARLSGDDQWIHVDVERAKRESPFGTTVAHGNLTLSLIDGLRKELIASGGFKLGVNYGWNRVRFPAPVPAGARVRASAEVIEVEEVGGGWWQIVTRFTVAVEGSEKPACVADSVGRALPE